MLRTARPLQIFFFFLLATVCGVAFADGSGTGFFISDDGYIATNWHVVRGGDRIRVFDSTNTGFDAKVMLVDQANDLAVLKVGGSHHSLPIRMSSQVLKGTSVFTIGFPRFQMQGREAKVTEGIVSSLSGINGAPVTFQISVPIQPGNSGGPLIDLTGAVVGITSAGLSYEATLKLGWALPENVNYAVKSNYLLELVGTDPNVRSRVLQARSDRVLPLTTLVERGEKSVVLIFVEELERQAGAAPPERSSARPPAAPEASVAQRAGSAYDEGMQFLKDKDYAKALQSFGVAAGLGHVEAMYQIGQLYHRGGGGSPNYVEALKWYRMAAAQGHARATGRVGFMHERGEGVAANLVEAVAWYRKAAELDEPIAQAQLARHLLLGGAGLAKDQAAAVSWLRKAASRGYADAEAMIALCYAQGWGVPVDYKMAKEWAERAAAKQNGRGLFAMGLLYLNGWGVALDKEVAIAWFEKAARVGSEDARQELAALRPGVPPPSPSAGISPSAGTAAASGKLLGTVAEINEAYAFAVVKVKTPVAPGTQLIVETAEGWLFGKAERQSGDDLSLTLTGKSPYRGLVGAKVYFR